MGQVGQLLVHGFAVALSSTNLLYCLLGCFLGTIVGVLPGFGPTAGMALLIPITAGLPPTTALIMLAGIYYGSMYGGSTTAILINMPGEAASVPTSLDGYQLAKQGRAGPALAIVALASFLAGTIGTLLLMLISPPLAGFALRFGPPEYFALILLGLTVIVNLAGRNLVKGIASGLLGLVLTTIGIDPVLGGPRFAFGNPTLMSGIDFICAIVGLFAVAEVFSNLEERVRGSLFSSRIGRLLPSRQELSRAAAPMVRGSFLGFLVGILPGASTVVSSFLAYDLEKKLSKTPHRFGQGAVEGIASCEAANNSAVSGGMVPLFTLGLPVSAPMGVLLGALMIHGLRPGPLLFQQNPEFVWGLIASMYIGNLILLVLNLPLVGIWVKLTQVPYPILAPLILALSVIGTYSVRNSLFDVWTAFGLGVLGFLMRKLDYPLPPLVVGLVLGGQFESALRQSLTMSHGNPLIFFSRPISLILVLVALASLILAAVLRRRGTAVAFEPD